MHTKQIKQKSTQKQQFKLSFRCFFYNKLDIGINQMYYFA